MGPPQSQNDRSAEKKQQLFHFTADQLDEIRRFRCSHPNVNYGNGVAGRTKLWNLNKWEVVPYTVCKYGLLVNGKEIRPITDSDDALILESIVLDNHDSFKSVKKKLHKSPYTVNAAALMRRHFDPQDDNIVSSIKAFILRVKATTHDSTTSNDGDATRESTTSNDRDSASEQVGIVQELLQVRQSVGILGNINERRAARLRDHARGREQVDRFAKYHEREAAILRRIAQRCNALAERIRDLEEAAN